MTTDPEAIHLAGNLDELKRAREMVRENRALLDKAEEALRGAMAREQTLVSRITRIEDALGDREDLAAKLKALQRDHDPERIKRQISEAVATATAELERQLSTVKLALTNANREIEELKASKRKLREALERLKERK